jgi:type IV pilus assembly protein PilY1
MKAAILRLVAIVSLSAAALAAYGTNVGPTDVPLTNSVDKDVKPTIMFILDDSGSMAWEYMPDSVNLNSGKKCYRSYLYNRVFYNPNITYTPPVNWDGTSYGNATYPKAKQDGFLASTTTDLTNWYYYNYTGALPDDGTCHADTSYATVLYSSLTAAQQQNVANWYTYYRTRILMMKSAITLAFKGVDDQFRIGYMSINNNTGSDFLNTAVFDAAGKAAWYAKITSAKANNGTGTRWALSTAGRLFGGQLTGQTFWGTKVTDPIKYSCQQNMTIMSTDGFWNSQMTGMGCTHDEGCKLNGSTIGDNDGSPVKPPFVEDTANTSADSLADIAYYYYNTDIRPDIATKNVFPVPSAYTELDDKNKFQHMNTHTIGLGVSGIRNYKYPYWTCGTSDTDCDYGKIKAGAAQWPRPVHDDPTAIDDLWHAAVNGHGRYFGAKDPTQVKNGLDEIIAGFPTPGAGGAAAVGNLVASVGDGLYLGEFKTKEWSGDLQKFAIVSNSPITVAAAASWSAQTQLDAQTWSTRQILMAKEDGSGALVAFSTANLTNAIASKWFDAGPTNPNDAALPYYGTAQYPFFSGSQITAATPTALINFLRGDRSLEDSANTLEETSATKLFRGRAHVLGDIVNSPPIYVGQTPSFDYQDKGYMDTFASKIASRTPMVFAGANDGMLHAFFAETGKEAWAFVPTAVMPYLFRLADKNYSGHHRYFVDGPITVGDADFGNGDWHTVLIGGLGKGGKAFYALDITDTAKPTLLWEYSTADAAGKCVGTTSKTTCDKDLGYTFGNAPMTRLNLNGDTTDTKWVALFASGYDNTTPGDSQGHLYMVDVTTGAKLAEMVTSGSIDPSLSGISWVNGWNDDGMHKNYVRQAYAGDLGGRIWRFDLKKQTATLMTTLGMSAGKGDSNVNKPQPVTTRIEMGAFANDSAQRVLYVGTGRYLNYDDVTNTDVQSIYAIRDTESSTTYPIAGKTNFRDTPAAYLLTSNTNNRTSSTFNYNNVTTNSYGWYMDFNASGGERVITHPRLFGGQQNNLTVVTNQPIANKCDIGGTGYIYSLNAQPAVGVKVTTSDTVYTVVGAMVMGMATITSPSGAGTGVITKSDGTLEFPPTKGPTYGNTVRRISWRELRN